MEEAIKKSEILIEALPYIKKFYQKTIVIKYGGSTLGDSDVRRGILLDIVFMNYAGMRPVLVHGGGPLINERMKKLNKKPVFVNGLRVTDRETMDLVDDALTEVNRHIVDEIKGLGGNAFGLIGKENGLLVAQKLSDKVDLGFAGKVRSVDTTVLDRLINTDIIPVISPVAIGEDGELYNVNADEAASNIAVALRAEKFFLLTNVLGVMRDLNNASSLFKSISVEDTKFLMEKNIIQNGMLPKVKACMHALEGKVKKAHIVDCKIPHALLLEIFTNEGIGTEIVKLGRRTKATDGL